MRQFVTSFGQRRQLNHGINIMQLEISPVIGNSNTKAVISVFYTKLMVLALVLQLTVTWSAE